MLIWLPPLTVLGLAAAVALYMVRTRPAQPERGAQRAAAARALAVALAVQAVHFSEELAWGFRERLGDVLGAPGMPLSFFVAFNVAWLLAWAASIPGVRAGYGAAFFAAWFLAVAAMANGVAHPLLAVASGGYFPGLVTAPVIAGVGIRLFVRLRAATQPVR